MQQIRIKSIIFTALSITTLTILGISLPFLSPLMVLVWPVPIIVLSVKEGGRAGIFATLLAGLVNAVILHPLIGLVTLIGFGLIGVVMGNAWAEGLSQKAVVLSGIGAGLLSELTLGIISYRVFEFNPVEQIIKEIKALVMMQEQIFTPGQMQFIFNNLDLLKQLYIGITVCTIIIVVIGSYYLSIYVLKKMQVDAVKELPFSALRFPPVLSIIIIVGFFVPGNFILENLLVIVSFALMLQGLSVFYFFLDKSNVSRVIWVVVLLLFFFIPLISIGFVILGMIDQVVNIRKRISGD